jgi:CRP-like cAMP-binding protein
MFNAIKKHIASFVDVPDNDFSAFENSLKLKNIKKGDYFVKEGQVCDFIGFINSGLFRMFYILNGKEINLHFFLDNEFVVVYNSFLTNTPSKFYIEALEDAELVVFYKNQVEINYQRYHSWERFGRKIAEHVYLGVEERTHTFLFMNAEERYLHLMHTKPQVFQKVQLYHIASYLGIERESLSRLRKKLTP